MIDMKTEAAALVESYAELVQTITKCFYGRQLASADQITQIQKETCGILPDRLLFTNQPNIVSSKNFDRNRPAKPEPIVDIGDQSLDKFVYNVINTSKYVVLISIFASRGRSQKEIANLLDLEVTEVRAIMKQAGIRPAGRKRTIHRDDLILAVQTARDMDDLASRFNMSKPEVRRHLQQNNIPSLGLKKHNAASTREKHSSRKKSSISSLISIPQDKSERILEIARKNGNRIETWKDDLE